MLRRLLGASVVWAIVASVGLAAEPATEHNKVLDAVNKMSADLKELKASVDKLQEVRGDVIALKTRIEMLELDYKKLKERLDAKNGSNVTLKPVEGVPTNPNQYSSSFKGMGHIRFVNQLVEEVAVVVNNRSYRLAPGEERVIHVAPGAYSYQVLNVQYVMQDRSVSADETKTITIYPR